MRPYNTTTLSFLFSLLILLQGCVVYKKSPVSLYEVARKNVRVKMVTRDGETYRYRYVSVKDSLYYGVKSNSNSPLYIQLTESKIAAVYPKDKAASTVLNLLPAAGFLALTIVGVIPVEVGIGSDEFDE